MSKFMGVFLILLGFFSSLHAEVTFYLEGVPADKVDQITSVMEHAVDKYNTYADYTINVKVKYSSGVPTAQASYNGPITFGGSISNKTAIHEMVHVMGVGTYWKWNNYRAGNKWWGYYASTTLGMLDGNTNLSADKWHFWPYGFNYNYEDVEKNIVLVGAFRQDMELSNKTKAQYNRLPNGTGISAGPFFIDSKGEQKRLRALYDNVNMDLHDLTAIGVEMRWELVPVGNYYYVDNVGARDAGYDFRLHALDDNETLDLVDASSTDDWVKWQIVPIGNEFFLENLGAKKDSKEFRLNSSGGYERLAPYDWAGDHSLWSLTDTYFSMIDVQWPLDDSTIAVANPALSWSAVSPEAASYDIYFGTSEAAVTDATTGSSEYVGPSASASYSPGALAANSEYFWRIDVVLSDSSILKGRVFSFFTEVAPNALNNGLLVDWAFDEGSDTTAFDLSGNANHGTLINGPSWTSGGVLGGAIQFDGIDDKVDLNPFGGPLSAFTVSVWVKAGALGQGEWASVFSNSPTADGDDFQIDVDGGIPGNYRYRGASDILLGPVTENRTHLAVACDGSTTRLYYNGNPISEVSEVRNQFDAILVGTNRNSNSYFQGTIDEIQVYNRVLNTAEIGALYNPVCEDSLFAHWKLDETSGTTVTDSAGGSHGTCQGGQSFDSDSIVGKLNGALDFDGTDDQIEAPAMNLNTACLTITGWLNADKIHTAATGIVKSRDGSTVAGLIVREDNQLGYNWNNDSAAWGFDTGITVPLNQWVFTAVVVEPAQTTLYMHDGTTWYTAINEILHDVEAFDGITYLGWDSQAANRHFDGQLDDLRIYRHSLRPKSIETLYLNSVYAPANLTASINTDEIDLDWDDQTEAGFSHYNVYRSWAGGDSIQIASGLFNSDYVDSGGIPGNRYHYTVAAVTDSLFESDSSTVASVFMSHAGDLDDDKVVNVSDLAELSSEWQSTYTTNDLMAIAEDWLKGTNLTVLWPMNGNADELSDYDYSGIPYGDPVWTSGAIHLDGVNDYVEVPGFKGILDSSPRTFSLWIRTTDNGILFSCGNFVAGEKWLLGLTSAGALQLVVGGGNTTGTLSLTDDQWHHIAVVLPDVPSVTLADVLFYIDGQAETVTPTSSQVIQTTAGEDFHLGAFENAGLMTSYWGGQLYGVRVYDRELSPGEITELSKKAPEVYYSLDEESGTTAFDQSCNLHHGQLYNSPQWQSTGGNVAGALLLDGTDDYVEIPGYKGVLGSSSRTCSLWIKTSDDGILLSYGNFVAGEKWLLGLLATGPLQLVVGGGNTTGVTNLMDNQWHHVTVVLPDVPSATLADVLIYIDGLPETVTPSSSQIIQTTAGEPFHLGAFDSAGVMSSHWAGLMDEVRIYDRALSEEEIAELLP